MKCQNEKCKKEHNGSYGCGKFCCLSCSKVRIIKYTTEWKKKLSDSVKNSEKFRINNKLAIQRKGIKRAKHICKVCSGKFETYPCIKKTYCSRKCYVADARYINRNNGGPRPGTKKYKRTWYTSPIAGRIHTDSSWELAYVKYLDENKIEWERNTIRFPYEFEGKMLNYIPDFYIKDLDEYQEVKGYITDKDLAKWKYFPKKLKILARKELKQIGVII